MLKTATDDIVGGTKLFPLAAMLAWEDLKDRYRRSIFGLAWIILSFVFFILVKSLIFRNMFSSPDYDYFSHLVIGFALYGFISQSITGAANLFVTSRMWILSTNMPYMLYANMIALRSLAELGFIAVAAGILVAAMGSIHPGHLWSLLPAVMLYYFTTISLSLMLASPGARYRDLIHAVQTTIRIMYFLTPVFWVAVPGTGRATVARWNPLTYYLDIVRVPLIEGRLPSESWMICLAISSAICLAGLVVFSSTKKSVPLWL